MIEIGMILDHGGVSKWYWWTDMIIDAVLQNEYIEKDFYRIKL